MSDGTESSLASDFEFDPSSQVILHSFAEDSYLRYAVASVKDRALPQIQDGQKPVQKRILFAMRQLGLRADTKPVKSARVVGDVIGRYHPHGDSAVYDAMVRMAQDFTLRYPVVEGQGNFGSRDKDPAAAYRYTEARLTNFSDVMLSELDRGTVDYRPNFDNTIEEPTVLPARLPVLLLNGTMGIAVGMASDIPPHNLTEVAAAARRLIEDPAIGDADVLAPILGPDFPDGGQLISSAEDIRAAYESGRGRLRLRARYEVEELARGQWQLVVKELPYQVSASKVALEIEGICNPQVEKGKSLTPAQATLKQAALTLIEKVSDESGKDDPIRLVLVPRSSKQTPEETMAFLFANTSLESTVSVNLTFIGLDGSPQTAGVPSMLRQWSRFRVDTVRRRVQFDLQKLRDRIHILEGRMIVLLHVDQVIRTIREAEEPKPELMQRFGLTEPQADDILEIRLRQLARLEGIRIERELEEARAQAKSLEQLLADDQALRSQVIRELDADTAKYGTPRRTLIKPEQKSKSQSVVAKSVVDEPVTILVSKNLWIRARAGHGLDRAQIPWKNGDSELAIIEARTSETLALLDSNGRVYSVDTAALPSGRGDGVPLSTLIDIQDSATLLFVLAGAAEQEFLFSGQEGYGFRAPLKALLARPRAGKAFLTLQEKEKPLPPVRLDASARFVACGSSDGRLLIFPLDEVKALDKGKGVKLLELAEGERMVAVHAGPGEPWELSVSGKTPHVLVQGDDWRKFCMHRARRGCQLPKKTVLV